MADEFYEALIRLGFSPDRAADYSEREKKLQASKPSEKQGSMEDIIARYQKKEEETKRGALNFLAELPKRVDKFGWKTCPSCGEDWLELRPSGECPDCDPPPMDKPKIMRKETAEEFLNWVDTDRD